MGGEDDLDDLQAILEAPRKEELQDPIELVLDGGDEDSSDMATGMEPKNGPCLPKSTVIYC